MNTTLINKAKEYCLDLLINSKCKSLPFHSYKHTLEVFENVQIIGKYEKLNETDLEVLMLAALFHDTGMSIEFDKHENISANYAHDFLRNLNFPNKKIATVINCIKATEMPQNPKTLLESIICDADLLHLASKEYSLKNELLRSEWSVYTGLRFTDEEWCQLNIDFLTNHKYHTQYGKRILEELKKQNIRLLKNLKLKSSLQEKN